MRAKSVLWIGLVCNLMVAGCGQKGPLRLPDAPPEQSPKPAATEAADRKDPTELSARRANPHE